MKNSPVKTSIEYIRQPNNEIVTRIDHFEDQTTSTLAIRHQKVDERDFLEINATSYTGLLTSASISSYLREMNYNLRASNITNLKLIGLTNENCEADLFRRQAESSFISGSFSQLKEVIFESGLSQEEIASGKYEPTTLPSKPFLRSEIEFIKFDGHQIIPQNFLINVSRVENIICPDNNNTHDFVQTYINDKYINLVLTQTDNQGFAEETSQSDTE